MVHYRVHNRPTMVLIIRWMNSVHTFPPLILVVNQLDAQNLFYNKFISCLYTFRAPCAHRQEVKIVLYSLWYHHTETSGLKLLK